MYLQFLFRSLADTSQGNVEYKLQLLSPSPARFARLVTQLKWRLLEGDGQAYYEIGVADSGALVGLPCQELEESLETLEAMAGEIGASVIVVKEIEVPPALAGLAQSQLECWESRRRKRNDIIKTLHDPDSNPSSTEPETEVSTTNTTDQEDIAASPASSEHTSTHRVASATSMGLEICSVYKPRPMRRRSKHVDPVAPNYFGKRRKHIRGKKGIHNKPNLLPSMPQDTGEALAVEYGEEGGTGIVTEPRTVQVNGTRVKLTPENRHGPKSEVLLSPSVARGCFPALHASVADDLTLLESQFEGLSIAVDSLSTPPQNVGLGPPGDAQIIVEEVVDQTKNVRLAIDEPRLIVEALVVRKMSIEDSYLDFGGFSLH